MHVSAYSARGSVVTWRSFELNHLYSGENGTGGRPKLVSSVLKVHVKTVPDSLLS